MAVQRLELLSQEKEFVERIMLATLFARFAVMGSFIKATLAVCFIALVRSENQTTTGSNCLTALDADAATAVQQCSELQVGESCRCKDGLGGYGCIVCDSDEACMAASSTLGTCDNSTDYSLAQPVKSYDCAATGFLLNQ